MSVWKCDVEVEVEAMGVETPDVGCEEGTDRLPGGRGEWMPVLVFLRTGLYRNATIVSHHHEFTFLL